MGDSEEQDVSKEKIKVHYTVYMMLQEWRKSSTLKGLSSSIAGYARSQNFLHCVLIFTI